MKKLVRFRHKVLLKIIQAVVVWVFFLRFHYKPVKIKVDDNKPFLLLSSHISLLDVTLISSRSSLPIYYVMSGNVATRGIVGKLMNYVFEPIRIKKGNIDSGAVRKCMQVARQGGSIGLFPSGNTSYSGVEEYIDPKIVKLVRMLKLPLVLFNNVNLYGADPRWGNKVRKGKTYGEVAKILSVEEYSLLSDEQLYDIIISEISFDAIKDAERTNQRFKSKTSAEYLERVLFKCPSCNGVTTLVSEGNYLNCSCGKQYRYNEDLTISGCDEFSTVKEWIDWQKDWIEGYEEGDSQKVIFSDEGETLIENIAEKGRTQLMKNSTIKLFNNRLHIENSKEEKVFYFDKISSCGMQSKDKLILFYEDREYLLKGNTRRSALKYVLMIRRFQSSKGVE